MNFLSVTHLVIFNIFLILLIAVIVKNPKSKLNRSCSLLILCFAIWNLGFSLMHSADTSSSAMFWMNISSFGWLGFPSGCLWFVIMFSGKKRSFKDIKAFPVLIFMIPLLLIFMQWRGFIVAGFVNTYYGWGAIWSQTYWPKVFFWYYIAFVLISLLLLWIYRKRTKYLHRKKQSEIIFLTALIPFIGGSVTDALLVYMEFYKIPPIGAILSIIWAGGLVYSITKYGLMSITPESAASDIIYSMADSLILEDTDGRIAAANKATLELLGYKKEELIGKTTKMIIRESEDLFRKTVLERLFRDGSIRKQNITYKSKYGENIPVSLSGAIVRGKSGELAGIVYIARDMRETIKKNNELQKLYKRQAKMRERLVKAEMREKLKKHEKLAMIGRLTGSVGHEIRNPLSSIKNAVYYIDKYGEISDDPTKKNIQIVKKEIRRVNEIVTSLMDFSRTTKIKLSKVNINNVLDEIIKEHKEEKKVEISREISPEAELILADPLKFEQLLKNLVKNAVQAIEGSGKIKIKTERKSYGINIYVMDTGKGMDEETKRKLFEPLYTTKSGGIGLGMSIIKDIIDAHKWELKVKTEKGKGTIFMIVVKEGADVKSTSS